ncbi:BTAD domain-containing putative transcriptional regulator [Amycolatopsis sp. 195334CR]|uniref:AfsR/SARP family transcriptional regulator n=1 Tax=Amycolatopsis sp. 195334CR TaxID=2814588 RepID=UPI001A8DE49B|nr:BTAD domain-containing putative transcriptional regulator [Amycolatopsis sp. 195334CR]MBN6038841.1 tetratricopeptide repeat protein [Amycolatopsis sp. 195334CR]
MDTYSVLGPPAFRGRLQRTLLGVLLARANRPVPADVLAEELWPGQVSSPAKLQLHIFRLRRVLPEPDRLSFEADAYRLRVLPGESDVERFESLLAEAAEHEPARRAELLRAALELWRAEPYDGLTAPMLVAERRRLFDRRLAATEELYRAEAELGHHAEVLPDVATLAATHPLRESLQALLMVCLHETGQTDAALALYREVRETMIEELGLEPGPELRALERRLSPVSPPREFTGRRAELSELDSAGPLVVLTGTAGVGKTSLARHWAHRVRARFPDGSLYVDLRGYGPDQPMPATEALATLLRALGVRGAGIPADPEERAARFRTLLDRKRLLLVLDNAAGVEQVRPLLPGTPSCQVVITSRDALAGLVVREGAHRIALDRLTGEEATELLRAAQVTTDAETTARLVERCARLPLALRIAAESIKAHPEADPEALGGDVRTVFSWSYHRLRPAAARLFRLFGVHPGLDIDLPALTALAGTDTRRAVDELRRAHLVEETADGRYQLHDLLRAYAVELASPEEAAEALPRLLGWYLYTTARAMDRVSPHESGRRPEIEPPAAAVPRFSVYPQALRWLDAERVNLLLAASPQRTEYAGLLSPLLWRYLDNGGYNDDALKLHTLALDSAEEPTAQAVVLNRIGLAHFRLWQREAAMRSFERASALHEPAARAGVLNNLGLMHAIANEFGEAARCYEEALACQRETGDHTFAAAILGNLGDAYRHLGEHERAAELLERSLATNKDTADRGTEAVNLCHFAALCEDTGRYAEALDYLDRTLTAAAASGHHLVHADARYQLGTVHLKLGEHGRARTHLREALEAAEAVGNRQLMARALNALGEAADDPAEAARHHSAALDLASAIGEHVEHARATSGMAVRVR